MIEFLQQQIFPGLHAVRANRIISKLYENQKSAEIDISEINGEEKGYISKLEKEIVTQLDRKIKVEDKAKSLLFIITLAITTITFSLTYLKENSGQIIPIIFVLLGVLNFVFGGIRALQTFNVKEFHVHQPHIDYLEEKFILKAEETSVLQLKNLVRSKSLNDLINTKTSNLTYASFILIRNGLVMFVLFFASTILLSQVENKKKEYTQKYSGINIIKINDTLKVKVPYTYEIKYEVKNFKSGK